MNLREQIQRDEGGYQRFAYQDSESYWTIGFGRCVDRRRGRGISLAEAEQMLDNDIRDTTADVLVALPWVLFLDEVRRAAFVNMAFNLGVQGLIGFKKALKAAEAGDWETTAAELRDSKWYSQVRLRADRIIKQLQTGEWQ